MKQLFTAVFALLIGSAAFGQITVENYERKVRSSVGMEIEIEAPTATNNPKCGEIKIEHKDLVASGGCAGTLIRTYTYSDDCGNTATAEIYIIRTDDIGPVFDNPPGHVTCLRSEIPEIPKVTATDANGMPVTIEYSEQSRGPIIARIWTATDTCGNETKLMQRITLLD